MELPLTAVCALIVSLLFSIALVAVSFGPLREGGVVSPRHECPDTDEYSWCEVYQDFMSMISLYLGVATLPVLKIIKRKWDNMEKIARAERERQEAAERASQVDSDGELSESEDEDEEFNNAAATVNLLTSVS